MYRGAVWPEIHVDALRLNFAAGLSFSENAAEINAKFGTRYTRNGCIGKAKRVGLTQAGKPKPAHKYQPRQSGDRQMACEHIADIVTRDISIYQLTDRTCRWPHGELPPYTYCGNLPWAGSPYCGPHTRLGISSGTRGEQMAARGLEKVT